jgi:hypothetical protein
MKKITKSCFFPFLVILALIGLSSCAYSKYYYQQGDVESAISTAVSRLRSNPKNWREALILEKAYNESFSKNTDRIKYLKQGGNPDCWLEIYDLYALIDKHQNLVKPLLPIFIKKEFRNANLPIIDVNEELIASKKKAAEYLYAHASELMKNALKTDYRKAYQEFGEIKNYFTTYKDVDALMNECYTKGQNYVLVTYKNNSNMVIPKDFEGNLLQINAIQFNSNWVKYYSSIDKVNIDFDYTIVMNIRDINISPEQLKEREYPEEKTIEDGWQYALDSKGNVKKDSLGNDIKVKKYTTVRCVLKETSQNKQGQVVGTFDIQKNNPNQLMQSIAFNENLVFTNIFAVLSGDERALSQESRRKLGGKPLPFPSNIQMVMDASNIMKGRLIETVRANVALLMN